MELDPLMLTVLGVIAGVLIVIIIVTLAIRIHASRSRCRLRGSIRGSNDGVQPGGQSGGASGNKVVVTTIEELDIDHNSSTASLMVMDHRDNSEHSVRSEALRSSASTGLTVAVSNAKNNPDLVPFIQQQQSKQL